MKLLNFKLKHPDDIQPWGEEGQTKVMHWFGLTDSEYWMDTGNAKLYEYTDEIIKHSKGRSKYVDYQLIRFIEDFTEIFEAISESLPDKVYAVARNHQSLYSFYEKAEVWLNQLPDKPAGGIDVFAQKYSQLLGWIHARTLTSSHLEGGPWISFFRHQDKISIVWHASALLDQKTPFWTAQGGEIEMEFKDFITQVENFGAEFFTAMQAQMTTAAVKNWGNVSIDKKRLMEEQKERQMEFKGKLGILKSGSAHKTNWTTTQSIMQRVLGL